MTCCTTKEDAVAIGRKQYSPGVPCINGHIANRRVIGNACIECDRLRVAKYRARYPNRVKATSRKCYCPERARKNNAARSLSRYGLDKDSYAAMLASQNNSCALCGIDTPGGKGRWKVDHDHGTGVVRGLLCNQCNIGLGYIEIMLRRGLLSKCGEYLVKEL
jgi:hypothetical protein